MKQLFCFVFSGLLLIPASCRNNKKDQNEKTEVTMKAGITEHPYGEVEGKPVTEYTITNEAGLKLSLINYGGIVTRIEVPDRSGTPGDVILGYDSLAGYLQKNNPYFGALVGRYGNRIANGKFMLEGKAYTLAGNDHGNSLHGGNRGYDKVFWNVEKLAGDSSLKLTYLSKDGEEGYPGNLSVEVIYSLGAANTWRIEYRATTDKPTPVNLTSHAYFNLSAGRDSTILGHRIRINADTYTPVNDQLIPTGQLPPVNNGPMDFTSAKTIGKDIDAVKGGYDHNWVLNRKNNGLEQAAVLEDSASGRRMEVWTTQPGLQFYTGNFLDGTLGYTRAGMKYVKHAALCLEAQHFPDSPNQPSFPNTILEPGMTYHEVTEYRFSVMK